MLTQHHGPSRILRGLEVPVFVSIVSTDSHSIIRFPYIDPGLVVTKIRFVSPPFLPFSLPSLPPCLRVRVVFCV